MRLSDFYAVSTLVRDRHQLVAKLVAVTGGRGLGVSINSSLQSQDMVDACRPAVVVSLETAIGTLDQQLSTLGMEIDI